MNDKRTAALGAWHGITNVPVNGLHQTGRELDTATFTLVMNDGRRVPIGPADRLWSRAQTSRALAVSTGLTLAPCKPTEYETAVNALIAFACDVEISDQDSLSSRVADYLDQYLRAANTDRDQACLHRAPFFDETHTYVAAGHLAKWMKREYHDYTADHLVRHALGELGYEQTRVNYTRPAPSSGRTSASYYRHTR